MKPLLTLIILSLFTICLKAQTITSLRIDPDNSRGGKSADFFDHIRFIPLETTKESMFGRISKMELTENYFIIYDENTAVILVFERNGKFKAKIKQRTSDEFIGSFTIDRKKEEIIVLVSGNKALFYSYNGQFKYEKPVLNNVGGFHYFNQNAIAFNINRGLTFSTKEERKYDLVYSNGFNEAKKSYLAYNAKYMKYDYNLPYTLFSGQADGTCFFSFPYDYVVSHLNDMGIAKQYKFNFPIKYALPNNFASDSSYAGKRKDYVFGKHQSNYQKITALTPFFKGNDYLIFHTEKIGGAFTYIDDLLYSLKTSSLYSLNRISGDSLSHFIPILDSHFGENLHYVHNDKLYSSIPAYILFKLKENSGQTTKYQTALENLYSKGSKKDNPVIIESTLKSGL